MLWSGDQSLAQHQVGRHSLCCGVGTSHWHSIRFSVLARIEKFSNLPVIIFLQLSKQKTSYLCGVFGSTKCERKLANEQFNTYLLICTQTRKIYEHSHRPVCQYIAPLHDYRIKRNRLYSRTPLIRPPSESHCCGRIRGMVAREGFV